MEKKTNKALIIAIVTVVVLIAIAAVIAVVVVSNNKRNQTVKQPETNVTTVTPSEETGKTEISEEPEVEEVAQEEPSEETVVETEETVEEQAYTDFDAWVADLQNDDSIKVLPGVLIWNVDSNKHEIVDYRYGYKGLEENDKVYVKTDDVKEIICNGVGIYDAEDDLFKTKYEGQLYIELENIKLDSQNNIRVEFYSDPDSLYIWEVE